MPTITSDVLLLAPLIGHVGNLNMELIGTSRVRHVRPPDPDPFSACR